nr:hypothetical protein CFP56_79346 [Quercus suber]
MQDVAGLRTNRECSSRMFSSVCKQNIDQDLPPCRQLNVSVPLRPSDLDPTLHGVLVHIFHTTHDIASALIQAAYVLRPFSRWISDVHSAVCNCMRNRADESVPKVRLLRTVATPTCVLDNVVSKVTRDSLSRSAGATLDLEDTGASCFGARKGT